MIWIGVVWDMKSGKLRISNERVDRLVNVIEKKLLHFRKDKVLYRATFVAGIVVQIISKQAVFGSLVRLRTRELYKCIVLRALGSRICFLQFFQ